jgi:alkanesulfonate monooxygenase SsuD/methylene tetrahydromethanopterin reductase-like flavin-dependent oxidoreductase (luciferase family)
MASCGRNPDDCKVLFLIAPIIGETEADALERKRLREARAAATIPARLAHLGKIMNIDFGKMDLDSPVPDALSTNGHQQTLEQLKKLAAGRTLRETMGDHNVTALSVQLIGTPDSVAAQMGEIMQEVGGDGFLFSMPNVTRRLLAEIEDGLVPALQDRGLVRSAYTHKQFRHNLLEY